jgi:hypothetical protein
MNKSAFLYCRRVSFSCFEPYNSKKLKQTCARCEPEVSTYQVQIPIGMIIQRREFGWLDDEPPPMP